MKRYLYKNLIMIVLIFMVATNTNIISFANSIDKNIEKELDIQKENSIVKKDIMNTIQLKKKIINEKEYYNLREYFNSLNNYHYFGEILTVKDNEFMVKLFNKKYLFNKDTRIIDYKKEHPEYPEAVDYIFSQRRHYEILDNEVYVNHNFLYHFIGHRKELNYNNLYIYFILEGYKKYTEKLQKYMYKQYGSKDIDLEFFDYTPEEFKDFHMQTEISVTKDVFDLNYTEFKKIPIVINFGPRDTKIDYVVHLKPLNTYQLNIDTNNWFIQQKTTGENSRTNCGPTSILNLIKWIYPETGLTTQKIRDYLDTPEEGIRISSVWKNKNFKKIFASIRKPTSKSIKKILDNGSPVMIGINSGYIYGEKHDGKGHGIVVSGYTEIENKIYFLMLDTGAYERKNVFKIASEEELNMMMEPRFGGAIYFKDYIIKDKDRIRKIKFLK